MGVYKKHMNRRNEVPSEDLLLCEHCGYIVSNIPGSHLCPECGKPIADSLPSNRKPPLWETDKGVGVFLRTTVDLILHPLGFYKALTPRGDNNRSRKFARIHIFIASLLFALCMVIQLRWILSLMGIERERIPWIVLGSGIPLLLSTMLFFKILNAMTVTLTVWESGFRGFRLPRAVVQRAMHYHTARYLPVAVVALGTIGWFHGFLAMKWITEELSARFLYILSAEVLIGAGYLFGNYVAAMFRLMRANSELAK